MVFIPLTRGEVGRWRTGPDSLQSVNIKRFWYSRMGMTHTISRIKGKLAKFPIFHYVGHYTTKKTQILWVAIPSLKIFIWLLNFKNIFAALFIWIFFKQCALLTFNDTDFSEKNNFWFTILFSLQHSGELKNTLLSFPFDKRVNWGTESLNILSKIFVFLLTLGHTTLSIRDLLPVWDTKMFIFFNRLFKYLVFLNKLNGIALILNDM